MGFKKSLKVLDHSITERNFILSRYLNEVAKIDLIDQEREVELTKKIKQGDKMAEEELINANLRFVISVAKNYQYKGLSLEDLINEGNIGLIRAARQFDETRGFKFISYAVVWIRNYILSALADCGRIVRLPVNRITLKSKINQYIIDNPNENEYVLKQEICKKFNINLEVYEKIIKSDSHYYLDDKVDATDSGSPTFADSVLFSENDFFNNYSDNVDARSKIQYGLQFLDEREKKIINDHYGILKNSYNKTCVEIANEMSLTNERVRQIKDNALRKLKRKIKQKFKSEIL